MVWNVSLSWSWFGAFHSHLSGAPRCLWACFMRATSGVASERFLSTSSFLVLSWWFYWSSVLRLELYLDHRECPCWWWFTFAVSFQRSCGSSCFTSSWSTSQELHTQWNKLNTWQLLCWNSQAGPARTSWLALCFFFGCLTNLDIQTFHEEDVHGQPHANHQQRLTRQVTMHFLPSILNHKRLTASLGIESPWT